MSRAPLRISIVGADPPMSARVRESLGDSAEVVDVATGASDVRRFVVVDRADARAISDAMADPSVDGIACAPLRDPELRAAVDAAREGASRAARRSAALGAADPAHAAMELVLRRQRRLLDDVAEAVRREARALTEVEVEAPDNENAPLLAPDAVAFKIAVEHEERRARAHGRTFAIVRVDRPAAAVLSILRPFDIVWSVTDDRVMVLLPEVDDRVVLSLGGARVARFPGTDGSATDWLAAHL